MRKIGNRWAMGFVGLGLLTCLGNIALSYGFAVSGERMTRTLRNMAFRAMVSALPCLLRGIWIHTYALVPARACIKQHSYLFSWRIDRTRILSCLACTVSTFFLSCRPSPWCVHFRSGALLCFFGLSKVMLKVLLKVLLEVLLKVLQTSWLPSDFSGDVYSPLYVSHSLITTSHLTAWRLYRSECCRPSTVVGRRRPDINRRRNHFEPRSFAWCMYQVDTDTARPCPVDLALVYRRGYAAP